MKKRNVWVAAVMVFAALIIGLVVSANARKQAQKVTSAIGMPADSAKQVSLQTARQVFFEDNPNVEEESSMADKLIAFAESFMGTPYFYTGKKPSTGFDCSGFTSYIYKQFGYEVSPASKEQVNAGRKVSLEEAKKGDLLIFTGTNVSLRQPGHVGIVISEKGQKPVRFIHSSSSHSNYGVTISQLDGTRYADRLLQVRRVLN